MAKKKTAKKAASKPAEPLSPDAWERTVSPNVVELDYPATEYSPLQLRGTVTGIDGDSLVLDGGRNRVKLTPTMTRWCRVGDSVSPCSEQSGWLDVDRNE